jgi:hypothetical protein
VTGSIASAPMSRIEKGVGMVLVAMRDLLQ